MTAGASTSAAMNLLVALLKGEDVPSGTIGVTVHELLQACVDEDLTGLVYERLVSCDPGDDWLALRDALADHAREAAATELLRKREIMSVLDSLGGEAVDPILLKGTALAYSVYSTPSSRPRCDTDLLIRRDQIDAVRRVMTARGYLAPPFSHGEVLFCQFEMEKPDDFGVNHAFDVHWKISTQPIFADVLAYDEVRAEAVPVPRLGLRARAPSPIHALLHACIHPAMHHRNAERLIWVYDIHLLASRLSRSQLDRFVDLASARGVAAVCAHALAVATTRFGTRVSDHVMATLAGSAPGEASAAYLQPRRRWHDELISSIRDLSSWRDRLRLLREVMFPDSRYILSAYGFTESYAVLIPVLYLHRLVRGAWKVLVGRK